MYFYLKTYNDIEARMNSEFSKVKYYKKERELHPNSIEKELKDLVNKILTGNNQKILNNEIIKSKYNIKELIIPPIYQSIESNCFTSLKINNIELPDTIKEIEDYAFSFCINLQNIKLPSKLEKINAATFNFCEKLESITIPETVYEIDHHAFHGCKGLKQIKLPDNLEKIGPYALCWCVSLKEINFPDSIKSLPEGLLKNSEQLEKIICPSSLNEIHKYAMIDIINLKEITLPSNIKYISDRAFTNTNIDKIIFEDETYKTNLNIQDFVKRNEDIIKIKDIDEVIKSYKKENEEVEESKIFIEGSEI